MRSTKLQQPGRERISVRNLAKELGLAPATVLAEVRALGEFVTSVSSMLEPPMARKVRETHGVHNAPETAKASGEKFPRPEQTTPTVPLRTESGPRPAARRGNNPFMNEVERPRDLVAYYQPRQYFDRPLSPPPSRDYTTSTAGGSWGGAEYFVAAAIESESWKLCGFSEVERDVWIDAGIPSNGARIAAAVLSAGMVPADLGVRIGVATVVERLLEGQSIPEVKVALDLDRARQAG